jgi:hypothetical protein
VPRKRKRRREESTPLRPTTEQRQELAPPPTSYREWRLEPLEFTIHCTRPVFLTNTNDPRVSRRIAARQRKKTEPERDHNNNLVSVATQTTSEKPEKDKSCSPPHLINGVPATPGRTLRLDSPGPTYLGPLHVTNALPGITYRERLFYF